MARTFSKVLNSLWTSSKKWAALDGSDQSRLLYLYLLTCPHNNSIGCFILKRGYIMADLGWSDSAIDRAIEDLCKVSLISYESREHVFKINGFLDKSPITNIKHAIGAVKLALELLDCPARDETIAELRADPYCQKIENVKGWPPETPSPKKPQKPAKKDGSDSPINSGTPTERERERERETETESKEEGFPEAALPVTGADPLQWCRTEGARYLRSSGETDEMAAQLIEDWLKQVPPSALMDAIQKSGVAAAAVPRRYIHRIVNDERTKHEKPTTQSGNVVHMQQGGARRGPVSMAEAAARIAAMEDD